MQLTHALTACGMLMLTGGCHVSGDPDLTPKPNRHDTGPEEPSEDSGPRASDAGMSKPDSDHEPANPSNTPDASMPQSDAASMPEPEPEPVPVDPHPEFAFVPSGAAARVDDFSPRDSAVLDCPQVLIDSSATSPLQTWCGVAPSATVVSQVGGPEVLVIPLTSLTIAAGTTVRITGDRPVVFLVQGHVAIDGSLDASARGEDPGPGGDVMCDASNGGDAKGREGHNGDGGGGGAFGSAGGEGGHDWGAGSEVGVGGVVRGNNDLVPLLGGCRGGHGGGCVGHPGGGGGAIQISASGKLVVRGTVAVDGGDGARACYLRTGGTGGGSGGALLFEAQTIDVTGATLRARGGRGGDGDSGASGGAGAIAPNEAGKPGGGGDPSGVTGFGVGGGGGGYGRIKLDGKTSCTGC